MIDISEKDVTCRTARARGAVVLGGQAFAVLKNGTCKKGDVLATAKVAAMQAAKATPAIVPMCHPILLEAIGADFELDEQGESVSVTVSVKSSGKTGVEMEALTAVSAACLSIYDMLKYLGKEMTISRIELLEKAGGKSGDYKRKN